MENKGNNNKNNGGNNNGRNNKNGMTLIIFIFAALMVLFLTSLLNSCARSATNKEVTYSEFIDMIENDQVERVTFDSGRIEIVPKSENSFYRITYYTAELNDESLLPLLKKHNIKFGGTVEDLSSVLLWNIASYILPLVIVWVLLYFLIFRKMGGGGVMGVGKSTAKVYVEKSTGVTFKDVAGQDEAKESLQEVVDFLHNPKKYVDIGAKLPKGALLVGPPGTGKTLLAKAVAGEAKVPFFSLAGSDFVEMFVGVGASRVRDLFKEAQKQAPCIIFIDEIDAIGKSRDTRYGGNDEREQTLNQLLAEMDGFDTSKGLLILAATNRPEVLDKALLRPGRFDRRIIVDKPDLKGRVETLKVHAKNVLMDDTVDLDAIGLATSGTVGSDLANMINEAAINAVKHGRKYVNQNDLFESVEVVIAGKEKKDRIMGPKEKKMVAYHEVGHALVTALQKDAEPVQKITIVPRTMGALGYTMQVPEEEKFLMTKSELQAHLVTYMGGRAAEEIVFDSVTTGASNDIEQATKIARAMVTQYGMSEKFGLMGLVTIENQYLDGRASLNCGEETAAQIDQEVMKILKESYDEAVRLLKENRDILDEIAEHLYKNETITGKEFMKIFRKLKGLPEPEEKTDAQKAAEEFKAEKTESVSKEKGFKKKERGFKKNKKSQEEDKWEEDKPEKEIQILEFNKTEKKEWEPKLHEPEKTEWKPKLHEPEKKKQESEKLDIELPPLDFSSLTIENFPVKIDVPDDFGSSADFDDPKEAEVVLVEENEPGEQQENISGENNRSEESEQIDIVVSEEQEMFLEENLESEELEPADAEESEKQEVSSEEEVESVETKSEKQTGEEADMTEGEEMLFLEETESKDAEQEKISLEKAESDEEEQEKISTEKTESDEEEQEKISLEKAESDEEEQEKISTEKTESVEKEKKDAEIMELRKPPIRQGEDYLENLLKGMK